MNPSTALASVLVDELVRNGVTDVVLCPGSRSAPLAYAVQAAEPGSPDPAGGPLGRLRVHVRVDERSAGFLALGLAKRTRRPAVVITTSGTAVANLHPAVLEADHARVPLIVLSADRPAELRGTGANQTTTQPGIFAGALRWSADLPAAEHRPGQLASWRTTACRAVAAARGELVGVSGSGIDASGPVHVNVAFREPLVPDLSDGGVPAARHQQQAHADEWPEPLDGRPQGRAWVERGTSQPIAPALGGAGEGDSLEDVERTLVVVGDLPTADLREAAVAWAGSRDYPVVAEPFGGSGEGVLPHGPLVLTASEWVDAHAPDRVVTIGRVTLSRAVASLLRRPGLRVEHVTAVADWTDPAHVVAVVHPVRALDVVHDAEARDRPSSWAQAWRDAGTAVAGAVTRTPPSWPSGLAVAATVADSLPPGARLFVGSSNAARDLDLGGGSLAPGVDVVANRGLAGIDGCVSTAVGLALTEDDPHGSGVTGSYALMGDLTFLHDANGLLIGPAEPRPDLTVVVVNDDGGGIFTLLEPGQPERADRFERIFGTPTGTDVGALCRAHGIPHERVATAGRLGEVVRAAPAGIRVVEVPVDRSGHRDAHDALRRVAAAALG